MSVLENTDQENPRNTDTFHAVTDKVKHVKVTEAYVDERLQETLSVKKIKVSFDNNSFFFSLFSCIVLKKNGYMVTTTLRNDWTKPWLLPTEKKLKI